MNQQNADIELIRKYFNGELSPTDQYEFEKRALDDPFLQDAVDGFEQYTIQQKDFEALENRLANRIKKKEKIVTVWGFKQWSIAASLIFGIAAISIYFNQTPENKAIAVSELQKRERLPRSVKILEDTIVQNDENNVIGLLENSPTVVQSDISTSAQAKEFSPAEEITLQPLAKFDDKIISDSIMLDEVAVVSYSVQAKRDASKSISRFNAEEDAKLKTESALVGKVSGANIARIKSQNNDQIAGKVIVTEGGTTLPGVQITNITNGEIVITDSKGEFKITADEKDVITAKYLGFLTETIAVNKRDSLNILLQPDQKSLSEVSLVGYGVSKNSTELFAEPKGGWKEFRKYLDEKTSNSIGEKGKVVVQFIIQPDGKLANFVIQKGINPSQNNKAIQLIKSYPTWYGATNGKAQNVKVTVRFK